MTKKIKIVVRRQEEIRNIGPRQKRIDPEEVRKALGAEKCEGIPERVKAAAGAPIFHRKSQ